MEKIKKSTGINKSEKILSIVGEKTFLNLWSYPNVFRDEGLSKSGVGKEVCDLLAVCGDHVIIFSIKDIECPNTGNIEVDWKRWSKRAILKSANQLFGAEIWLDRPKRLFLDPKCTQFFPIDIPNKNDRKVHLIVVALGAKTRCQNYFNQGSGSLMLIPRILGKDLEKYPNSEALPFQVGDLNPKKNFIHIFDEVTLNLVLEELDTVSDFVHYLERKEIFIREGHLISAVGEEELLGWYLKNSQVDRGRGFFFTIW